MVFYLNNLIVNYLHMGEDNNTMVVEEKNGWIIFKPNPPCRVYSCSKCSYRVGYFCKYPKKGEEEGVL